eukprot:scaffold11619_cov99-Isochrysis_galbana.AAC.1
MQRKPKACAGCSEQARLQLARDCALVRFLQIEPVVRLKQPIERHVIELQPAPLRHSPSSRRLLAQVHRLPVESLVLPVVALFDDGALPQLHSNLPLDRVTKFERVVHGGPHLPLLAYVFEPQNTGGGHLGYLGPGLLDVCSARVVHRVLPWLLLWVGGGQSRPASVGGWFTVFHGSYSGCGSWAGPKQTGSI